MARDTLSDVLRSVRLRGAVFYYMNYGPDWAAEAPAATEIAAAVLPGAEHVMEYHVVTKGSGWAAVVGQQPVRLGTGDIVVFPHGDPHVMSSAPGMRPTRFGVDWVFATRNDPKPIPIYVDGVESYSSVAPPERVVTNVVCGFLGCDIRPFNPLIEALPRLLHLPARGDGEWVAQVMQQAVAASQSRRPGGEALLERMSEMMFVDAIGRYVDSLPDSTRGWLGGLRDRHVGRALALMHEQPARDWTVEMLASESALSRSALHDRFLALIGEPPMQYLTRWRMQQGSRMLRDGDAPVAAIALDVGYDSEAAFARAFKRMTGSPPATWRRQARARDAAGGSVAADAGAAGSATTPARPARPARSRARGSRNTLPPAPQSVP